MPRLELVRTLTIDQLDRSVEASGEPACNSCPAYSNVPRRMTIATLK
jgi:hypothetical protein